MESLLGTVEQHISAQGVRCSFSSHVKCLHSHVSQFHEIAPLTRTWLWSTQLPQIPQPSRQRNTLILILTWGTETSAGPLNSASEHRSKIYCHKPLVCGVFSIEKSTLLWCRFKGTLWMSEEHPLSLVEQVTPIIDLMARTSSHFARLRDFVTLKFPPGFPVKIGTPVWLFSSC